MQRLFVALVLGSTAIFGGLQSALAKTVPYSSTLSASSLKFECGLMGSRPSLLLVCDGHRNNQVP
jgi:hypothetical protein